MIQKILIFFSFLMHIFSPVKTVPNLIIPSCPEGYILVQDFCVMKYDAKCSNPDPKCVTSEGVYKNDDPKCTCEGNFKVISSPVGAPITYIPEDDGTNTSAKSYCKNLGQHLMNNNEWMIIARNIEKVESNWTIKNGVRYLSNGHSYNKPSKALPYGASLKLSNNEEIWDFAGNVWQWVDGQVARKDEPRTIIPGLGNSRWTWGEFQTVKYSDEFMPSDATLNSKNGVGRIYHFNSIDDTDTTIYTYIRGGNWRHGDDSGVFTIHMQPIPSKTGIDDIGFRCVTNPN